MEERDKMIRLNNAKMLLCQNCGFYYNENDITELQIITNKLSDQERELRINLKVNLCINCKNELKTIL